MELNAEQIIKALEYCITNDLCNNCPVGVSNCHITEDALALILSYEEKIFELENRLKECENGYEGTLYLESCKLHDAEERIKELTKENERLRDENEALAISEVKECEISQMLVYRIRNKRPAVMAVISDTVREFSKRLKSLLKTDYINGTREYALSVIDRIAQEMLEGE